MRVKSKIPANLDKANDVVNWRHSASDGVLDRKPLRSFHTSSLRDCIRQGTDQFWGLIFGGSIFQLVRQDIPQAAKS